MAYIEAPIFKKFGLANKTIFDEKEYNELIKKYPNITEVEKLQKELERLERSKPQAPALEDTKELQQQIE